MQYAKKLRESLEPPLLLWEIAPKSSSNKEMALHHWKFAKSSLVDVPNNLYGSGHRRRGSSAQFLHAKKWANIQLTTLQDGRGVLMGYTSLDNKAGCWKQIEHPLKEDRKGKPWDGAVLSVYRGVGGILGCTGLELLSFSNGELQQTPLAARRTRVADVSAPWRSLPLMGASMATLFYPYAKSSYALVLGTNGITHLVDITTPTGAPVISQGGASLVPQAVTSGLKYDQETAGTVVAGFEGESPVGVSHGTDVFVMTSFQRLWRFDAMQVLPCGNVNEYFKKVFKGWNVPAGSTKKQVGTVMLRSAFRAKDNATANWVCELSKKTDKIMGAVLVKSVACW